MSPYELGNLILQVLAFTVLTVGLWKLFQYTASTQDLARAAVEEMSRPCVQVFEDIDETDEGMIGGHSASIVDMDYIAFRNIGTAPALNFRYEVQTSQTTPYSSKGPSLLPGQVFTCSKCPARSRGDRRLRVRNAQRREVSDKDRDSKSTVGEAHSI